MISKKSQLNLLLTILISITLISQTNSICSKGCLSCSEKSSSTCTLCDFTNSYILNNDDQCIYKKILNCQLVDFHPKSSKCLVCSDHYYYDEELKKCVKVPISYLISNCKKYDSSVTCTSCEQKYVLENYTCSYLGDSFVQDCQRYEDKKCIECQRGYQLNESGTCENLQNSISGCNEYSNLECKECNSQYLLIEPISRKINTLDDDTILKMTNKNFSKSIFTHDLHKFCKKNDFINCLKIDKGEKCTECMPKHYPVSDTKCRRNPNPIIQHCSVYHNISTCAECELGFYIKENKCLNSTNFKNCLEHDKTSDKCIKCHESFYLTDDSEFPCKPQDKEHCVQYVSSTNTCTRCEDLFFVQDKSCSPVDFALNCLHSKGFFNKCSSCAGDHFIDGSSCKKRENAFDPNCAENSNSYDDTSCSICKQGTWNVERGNVALSIKDMDELACAIIDRDHGLCQRCAEGAYSIVNGICIFSKNTNSVCLQLDDYVIAVLNQNDGHCVKCRNYDTHYLKEKTCFERKNWTTKNCKKLSMYEDACLGWEPEQIIYRQTNIGICTIEESEKNKIDNCKYYDAKDLTKCIICEDEMIPTDDGHYCQSQQYSIVPMILNPDDIDLQNHLKSGHPDLVKDCISYYYHKEGDRYLCEKCENSKFPIIDIKSKLLVKSKLFPITECALKSSSFIENCRFFVKSHLNSICIACKQGYSPVYENQNSLKNLKLLTDSDLKSKITKCHRDNLSLDMTNFGYQYEGLIENAFVNLLSGSSCLDDSQYLVIFFNELILPESTIVIPDIFSGSSYNMYQCLNNISNKIANCGLYWSSNNFDLFSTQNEYKCLACAKGFRPIFDLDTRKITFCEIVSNCENGVYINGCRDCQFNKNVLIFDSENYMSNYNICLEDEKDFTNNCAIADKNKCLVCQQGYDINDKGVCLNDTSAKNNCIKQGFWLSMLPSPKTQRQRDTILEIYERISAKINYFGCLECEENYRASILTNADFIRTPFYSDHPHLGKVHLSPIDGCQVRKNFISQKCEECKAGYLMKIDDFTCISQSSIKDTHPNCLTLKSLDNQLVCDLCDLHHSLDEETHLCSIDNHCLKYVSESSAPDAHRVCTLCEDNYKPNMEKDNTCIPVEDPNDHCSKYSAVGVCVSCKNPDHLAVNAYKNMSQLVHFCIPYNKNQFPRLGGEGYEMMGLADNAGNIGSLALVAVPDDYSLNRITFIPKLEGYFLKNICVTVNIDVNCYAYNDGKCKKCKYGYFLNSLNICVIGKIDGCKDYETEKLCLLCKKGFYKTNLKQCAKTTALNCEEFSENSNECKICKEDFYIHEIKGDCNKSKENCNKCITYTKNSNCLKMQYNFDACIECTVPTFKVNDEGLCVPQNITEKCIAYDKKTFNCLKCESNFYLESDSKNCLPNPDGIIGCIKYLSRNKCDLCKHGMFLINNECQNVTKKVEDCQYYKSDGECLSCKASHLLVNKKCKLIRNSTCKSWIDVDNCKTCFSQMVLQKNNSRVNCVPLTIPKCVEGLDINNKITCSKCSEQLMPSTDKLSCIYPMKTIFNCLVYNQSSSIITPTCEQCKSGTILSENNLECLDKKSIKFGACKYGKKLSENQCIECSPGFIYLDGQCTACGGIGCFKCYQDQPEKCLICQPQFSMKTFGTCDFNGRNTSNILSAFSLLFLLVLYASESSW